MSKEELQVNFRMPASLKGELEAMAKRNHRSLTAEIVARLERSINDPDDMGISDRDRMDPESVFFTDPSSPPSITTKIDKEQLLSDSLKEFDPYQPGVSDALRRAYEAIQALDVLMGNASSSKGPKPRKKFRKE